MKKYIIPYLFFLIGFVFNTYADSDIPAPANVNGPIQEKPSADEESVVSNTAAKETQVSPKVADPKPDLASMIFYLDPSLNLSLGFEINDGDVHLIVEMDHNPTRNEFVFSFDKVIPNLRIDTVGLGNASFGFHNLPIAFLPMIEIDSPQTSSAKFILGEDNFRTHQRVNLTKILRELANKGMLIDTEGNDYEVSMIKDFEITVKVSPTSESKARKIHKLRISTSGASQDKIIQIYGEQKLAELVELHIYEVGDVIQLPQGYKIPYRSKSTQWVIKPEQSTDTHFSYQLINNPNVGDQYTIPVAAENIERVLPKVKKGYMWFESERTETEITYLMIQESVKFNPNILYRYLKNMFSNLEKDEALGIDSTTSVLKSLSQMPISFRSERLEVIVPQILAAEDPSQIMQILMMEQYYYPVIKVDSLNKNQSINQCSGFLE